jgi:hypothetical protein
MPEQDYWLTQPKTSCVAEIHRLERCYDAVRARAEEAESRLRANGPSTSVQQTAVAEEVGV